MRNFDTIIADFTQKIETLIGSNVTFSYTGDGGTSVPSLSCYQIQNGFNIKIKGEGQLIPKTVARFYLATMPGCCGVMVSHHTWIDPVYRKKGLGSLLMDLKVELALRYGFTALLATDVTDNTGQQKLFKKKGWTEAMTFTNDRTDNEVGIYHINMRDR